MSQSKGGGGPGFFLSIFLQPGRNSHPSGKTAAVPWARASVVYPEYRRQSNMDSMMSRGTCLAAGSEVARRVEAS